MNNDFVIDVMINVIDVMIQSHFETWNLVT